jgi:hypothetical protein
LFNFRIQSPPTISSTRQLAAIMFNDIVGYTSLMGKDEKCIKGFYFNHSSSDELYQKKSVRDIFS